MFIILLLYVCFSKWMKNLIGTMDFKALEMKMFKCKVCTVSNKDHLNTNNTTTLISRL